MTLLADSFMMKADKGSMANSVEERTPYLDKRIMELAFNLPESLKIAFGEEKIALRSVGQRLLPKPTTRRRKKGYGTPVAGWVAGEVGSYLSGLIEESFLLNRVANRQITSKIVLHRLLHPKQFWMLGAVALWERVFFSAGRGSGVINT